MSIPSLCRKTVLLAGLLIASACNQSSADQFINITGQIVADVQVALPIVGLFVPPPYNLLEPTIATFLNLANTAAANIANAAATNGTALSLTQTIVTNLGTIALDPTVLAKLPTSIQGANGPVNTQALIQALVTVINNAITLAAHQAGATVTTSPTNVIVSVQAPAVAANAKLAHVQVKMTQAQMDKISEMLEQTKRNRDVMSAYPSAATIKANQMLGR